MKQELKLVLDKSSVDTALKSMAKSIYDIGYPLAIVAIMKGGGFTAYDLFKRLSMGPCLSGRRSKNWPPDIVIGHIGLESYGDEMKSQGEVKLMTPLDLSRNEIRNRNVIIVDDCVETSNTLNEACRIIAGYHPLQMYTAVLVDKVILRAEVCTAARPDIVGWTYSDKGFLVGCGMGAGEDYRGLPELYEIVVGDKDV